MCSVHIYLTNLDASQASLWKWSRWAHPLLAECTRVSKQLGRKVYMLFDTSILDSACIICSRHRLYWCTFLNHGVWSSWRPVGERLDATQGLIEWMARYWHTEVASTTHGKLKSDCSKPEHFRVFLELHVLSSPHTAHPTHTYIYTAS